MANHEVFDKEYDCRTPDISVDGFKSYHAKGDGPRTCKACARYRDTFER